MEIHICNSSRETLFSVPSKESLGKTNKNYFEMIHRVEQYMPFIKITLISTHRLILWGCKMEKP